MLNVPPFILLHFFIAYLSASAMIHFPTGLGRGLVLVDIGLPLFANDLTLPISVTKPYPIPSLNNPVFPALKSLNKSPEATGAKLPPNFLCCLFNNLAFLFVP